MALGPTRRLTAADCYRAVSELWRAAVALWGGVGQVDHRSPTQPSTDPSCPQGEIGWCAVPPLMRGAWLRTVAPGQDSGLEGDMIEAGRRERERRERWRQSGSVSVTGRPRSHTLHGTLVPRIDGSGEKRRAWPGEVPACEEWWAPAAACCPPNI